MGAFLLPLIAPLKSACVCGVLVFVLLCLWWRGGVSFAAPWLVGSSHVRRGLPAVVCGAWVTAPGLGGPSCVSWVCGSVRGEEREEEGRKGGEGGERVREGAERASSETTVLY